MLIEIRDGWLKLALLCQDKLIRRRGCALLKGLWLGQGELAEWLRAQV